MGRPGRRRTDRADWPLSDVLWFWARRVALVTFAVVPILCAIYIALSSSANTNRDEARKYQACEQRRVQNMLLRDGFLSSRTTQLLQAARTDDNVVAGRLTVAARLNGRRAAALQIPDCPKTYPRGFEHSRDFPDLVPARPPTGVS